jgi:peptidoglycan/xylan/chitin deacetylase (PgdA/CDA1 family)
MLCNLRYMLRGVYIGTVISALFCCLPMLSESDEAHPVLLPVKQEIPVLCYHNLKSGMKGHNPQYTITGWQFRRHMQMLADSGFHSILPDQLYAYLTSGMPLPERPIMITFDDTREEQFNTAAAILDSLGMKGVFFVMTIPIGKPGYMTAGQIKQLSDNGHVIGCHTWDHPDVRYISATAWDMQISRPKQALETITGKKVSYFAYPYGAWNGKAIAEIKTRGIKAAFQLSNHRSNREPLFTIRRLMVPGDWSEITLYRKIQSAFQ